MKIINSYFFEKKRQNICNIKDYPYLCTAFKKCNNMVTVVQLVRASDCGSECRGFESLQSPKKKRNFSDDFPLFFIIYPLYRDSGFRDQRNNLRDFIFKHII